MYIITYTLHNNIYIIYPDMDKDINIDMDTDIDITTQFPPWFSPTSLGSLR